MRKISEQLQQFTERAANIDSMKSLIKQADTIKKSIQEWEEKLIQPKSQSNDDVINFENKLSANLIFVKGELDGTSFPTVTQGERLRFAELHKEWLVYKAQMEGLLQNPIRSFNIALRNQNWEYIGQKD